MHTYAKFAIAALVVSAALAALVGTASARDFSISNQNIRVVWSSLEFVAGTSVRCGVTLEGSFHARTIPKNVGILIGYITRASFRRPCTGGTAWAHNGETNEVLASTFANNLPWHITYGGFTGTLPTINQVRFGFPGLLFTLRLVVIGFTLLCEYLTDAAHGTAIGNAIRNVSTGVIDHLRAEGRIRSGTGNCPEISLASREEDGLITLLNATTKITVTLI